MQYKKIRRKAFKSNLLRLRDIYCNCIFLLTSSSASFFVKKLQKREINKYNLISRNLEILLNTTKRIQYSKIAFYLILVSIATNILTIFVNKI